MQLINWIFDSLICTALNGRFQTWRLWWTKTKKNKQSVYSRDRAIWTGICFSRPRRAGDAAGPTLDRQPGNKKSRSINKCVRVALCDDEKWRRVKVWRDEVKCKWKMKCRRCASASFHSLFRFWFDLHNSVVNRALARACWSQVTDGALIDWLVSEWTQTSINNDNGRVQRFWNQILWLTSL